MPIAPADSKQKGKYLYLIDQYIGLLSAFTYCEPWALKLSVYI
jgi:hypothetical protein